jgi:hypothetical protein
VTKGTRMFVVGVAVGVIATYVYNNYSKSMPVKAG